MIKKILKKTAETKKKVTAKKTTKKTVAKKGVTKTTKAGSGRTTKGRKVPIKRATKNTAPLVVTSEENAFYAVNGSVLHSLLDLHSELATMLEEEFLYHADPESNHFSFWIADVICDEECAKDLRIANTRRKARTVLKKHLKKYSY